MPCFGSSNSSVAASSGEFQNSDMTLKQPEIIEVPDDNDFLNSGPQNPVEAQSYRDKLNAIMNTFSDLLADNCKDALRSMITSLKKLMVKHWWQMAEADMDAVLKSIHDPSCVYLHQHLTTQGINMMELVTEVPEGWTFLRQLPKKVQKTEVWELIVTCFNHLLEAHAHMSSFAANMSSLAKIADPKTFDMVMKVAAQPMIQINVLECYLSPVQDPPPKTTAEEHLSQLEKSCSPDHCLLHRNHSMDPPSFWLQLFGSISNASFSMVAPPRRLALCLRCGPSSFPTCCQVKFTSVDLLEPPKRNESSPTPWPMREMWLVMTPLPPPHQEVNEAHHHCKSSSLHSSPRRCQTTVCPPSPQ